MKKLIPALCMLLVAATLLGTSTYAWFSMNTSVTASGMNIKANSDSPYLVISETQSGTFDKDANAMVLNPVSGTALKLVTPLNVASNVKYYADAAAALSDTKTTPTKFTNAETVLWGTAESDDPADAQVDNTPTLVTSAKLAEYVQISELWFKLAADGAEGTNLKCTKVTFSAGTNTIAASGRVLFVTETGRYQLFKVVDGDVTAAVTGSDAALFDEVTTTAQKVTVYFYFDGTDSIANTNAATDLSQISANFTFAID